MAVSAGSGPATAARITQLSASAPHAATFSRVGDLLDKMKKKAEEAKKKLNEGLTPANKAAALDLLDDIEFEIDTLLDPNTLPTLVPAVIGDVIATVNPITLGDFADETVWLATDAHDESMESLPSHYLIGSYVLTIQFWLDDYRQAIEDA